MDQKRPNSQKKQDAVVSKQPTPPPSIQDNQDTSKSKQESIGLNSPKSASSSASNILIPSAQKSTTTTASKGSSVANKYETQMDLICHKQNHDASKNMYVCVDTECQSKSRLGCAHCFLDEHEGHQQLKIEEFQVFLNDIKSANNTQKSGGQQSPLFTQLTIKNSNDENVAIQWKLNHDCEDLKKKLTQIVDTIKQHFVQEIRKRVVQYENVSQADLMEITKNIADITQASQIVEMNYHEVSSVVKIMNEQKIIEKFNENILVKEFLDHTFNQWEQTITTFNNVISKQEETVKKIQLNQIKEAVAVEAEVQTQEGVSLISKINTKSPYDDLPKRIQTQGSYSPINESIELRYHESSGKNDQGVSSQIQDKYAQTTLSFSRQKFSTQRTYGSTYIDRLSPKFTRTEPQDTYNPYLSLSKVKVNGSFFKSPQRDVDVQNSSYLYNSRYNLDSNKLMTSSFISEEANNQNMNNLSINASKQNIPVTHLDYRFSSHQRLPQTNLPSNSNMFMKTTYVPLVQVSPHNQLINFQRRPETNLINRTWGSAYTPQSCRSAPGISKLGSFIVLPQQTPSPHKFSFNPDSPNRPKVHENQLMNSNIYVEYCHNGNVQIQQNANGNYVIRDQKSITTPLHYEVVQPKIYEKTPPQLSLTPEKKTHSSQQKNNTLTSDKQGNKSPPSFSIAGGNLKFNPEIKDGVISQIQRNQLISLRKDLIKKVSTISIYRQKCKHTPQSLLNPFFECCQNVYPCSVCHDMLEAHQREEYFPSQRFCLNCLEFFMAECHIDQHVYCPECQQDGVSLNERNTQDQQSPEKIDNHLIP